MGKTLAKVVAEDDGNVFGKVGTSGYEVMKALSGKKVVDAKQQGKYFWCVVRDFTVLVIYHVARIVVSLLCNM